MENIENLFSFDLRKPIEIEPIKPLDSKNMKESLIGKNTYCCITYDRNDNVIDKHQYREYPILAEAVCIRHAYMDGATRGSLSKGKCSTE